MLRNRTQTGSASFVCSTAGLFTLIGSLLTGPAFGDTLKPYIGAGIAYDNNLFRLSDESLREMPDSADTYHTVTGGMRYEWSPGRQVISGVADLSSVRFDHNRQLDYTGKNLSGEWHWFFASHFEGHIGGSYKRELVPFADFHSDQRNLRIDRRQFVDSSWRFHPSWRWVTSYTKDQYTYELPVQRLNDRSEESITSGLDYLAASGSTVGLQFRKLRGSYLNGQLPGAEFLGNGYTQHEAKLNTLWVVTGRTQIAFLGGWVQRTQNSIADRVESGTNARLIINWMATGRVKLAGQAWREFAAIDGTLIDSALTSGVSALATWDFSEKIQVEANVKREKRKFTPFNEAAFLPVDSVLSDRSTMASIGLAYKPLRNLTVKASAFRDQRQGSVAAGTNSYDANGASLTFNAQF